MSNRQPDERELRFALLFNKAFNEVINPAEFAENDFYAFQVIERAMRTENQELRNLAFHLEAERGSGMEVINVRSPNPLEATRRMKTLAPGESAEAETAADEPAAPPKSGK